MKKIKICITSGEPAGIGPEISLKTAIKYINNSQIDLTIIGDINHLAKIAHKCNIDNTIFSQLHIEHIPLTSASTLGQLDKKNANYVLKILDFAIKNCTENNYDAMVTAPIHKGILNNLNFKFSGHTEYLAEKTNTKNMLMLLSGQDTHTGRRLRVALATTHIALKDVISSISIHKIEQDLILLNHSLRTQFNILQPQIKIAGINPHAGENGYIGNEEIYTLQPVINKLQQQNINVSGPYAGDTLFLQHSDCFYCMYHDQGLAPFKYATFGHGVNITLGLPIIRTSVDHGTALDIASQFNAKIKSMQQAIEKACMLVKNATLKTAIA